MQLPVSKSKNTTSFYGLNCGRSISTFLPQPVRTVAYHVTWQDTYIVISKVINFTHS